MRIETKKIEDLQPASYNPRKKLKVGEKRFEAIARSVEEFGLVQPLVWNETTGRLVGGHQRLEVLKSKGVDEVEVVVVELEEAREKALNVALNNPLIGGEWDVGALETLVSELSELPAFDVTLTGFCERDLNDWKLTESTTFQPESPAEKRVIEVTLVVPRSQWDDVEDDVNELVKQHKLGVHVRDV